MTIGSLELALLPRPETYVWCVCPISFINSENVRMYLAVLNLFRQLNLGSTNSQLKKPIVNFELTLELAKEVNELAFWSRRYD